MPQDAMVSTGDIARLAAVGRAAVSNWRRRHENFPQPVGGTASSPLFSLREIEEWLRHNGKPFDIPLAERTWQRLRLAGDDLRLGDTVAAAGALLLEIAGRADGLPGPPAPLADRPLVDLITELAAERGPGPAFEFLCARYREAHSRRLVITPPDVAELMVRLALPPGPAPDRPVVLDPACGLGTLPLAALDHAPTARPLARDADPVGAAIAATRLLLRGADCRITVADSLRAADDPGEPADVVLCEPPFHERAWGHAELAADPRWIYGVPPRGEPELAWVQHCLARTRPGGSVAILMPAAAAARRPGRRIRRNLLRAGALRAVIGLAAGGPDLWLLRSPRAAERKPAHLFCHLAPDRGADADLVAAWHRFLREPDIPPAVGRVVPIVELLDDDVDLGSLQHRRGVPDATDLGRDYRAAFVAFRAGSPVPPDLAAVDGPAPPTVTIGELARAGLLTIRHAARALADADGGGTRPVLTADDLALGREPTGRTADDPGLPGIAAGDVVASVFGAVRVIPAGGAALGPGLTGYRVDPERIDPDFLAGVLRADALDRAANTGSSRIDGRRVRVPRLPLAEQRAIGARFRALTAFEDELRVTAERGARLLRLGWAGLVAGRLRAVEGRSEGDGGC